MNQANGRDSSSSSRESEVVGTATRQRGQGGQLSNRERGGGECVSRAKGRRGDGAWPDIQATKAKGVAGERV